jgi:hypothetical protein
MTDPQQTGPIAEPDEITFLPDEDEDGFHPERPFRGRVVCMILGALIGLLRGLEADSGQGGWIFGMGVGAGLGYLAWRILVLMVRGPAATTGEEWADADERHNQS